MKIYVWRNDVLLDLTSGLMCAVAESVEAARAALINDCGYIPEEDLEKEPEIFELNKPIGFVCWGGG